MRLLSSVLRRGPSHGLALALALTLALTFLSFLSPSRAATTDFGAKFLFPFENDVTYNYLDVLNVSYLSRFHTPFLYTFCGNYDEGTQYSVRLAQKAEPLNGSILVTLNWTSPTECSFHLRPSIVPGGHGVYSPEFFLLRQVNVQATIGQFGTSTSTGATATAATTTSRTSLAGAPTTGTPPADSNAGLQTGAKIGISIGIFIAVVGGSAGIAAAVVVRRRRTKRDAPCAYQAVTPPPPSSPPRFSTIGSPARSTAAHDSDKAAASEIDSTVLRPSGGGTAGPDPNSSPSELA